MTAMLDSLVDEVLVQRVPVALRGQGVLVSVELLSAVLGVSGALLKDVVLVARWSR